MALVHPGRPKSIAPKRELHPALCLLSGFAVLVAVAMVVHFLFGLF